MNAYEKAVREIAELRVEPCTDPHCVECKPIRIARAALSSEDATRPTGDEE